MVKEKNKVRKAVKQCDRRWDFCHIQRSSKEKSFLREVHGRKKSVAIYFPGSLLSPSSHYLRFTPWGDDSHIFPDCSIQPSEPAQEATSHIPPCGVSSMSASGGQLGMLRARAKHVHNFSLDSN